MAAGRKDGKSARKRKRTVSLSAEAWRLIDVHAVGVALTPSAVIEGLARAHCRRFVLCDRKGPSGAAGELLPPGDAA